jgi:predicted ATPase
MDSASWGLLLSALQSLKGILFILSMRPLEQPLVEYDKLCKLATFTRLTLPPLAFNEVNILVQQRLSVKRLPEDIAQQVSSFTFKWFCIVHPLFLSPLGLKSFV